jgi:serine/threonine-protein kinase
VRLIAQGGQGAVYEALDERISKRGALKVLLSFHGTAALVQRFINEARAVNAIRHINIPQCIDHGLFDDGVPWIVMDFLEGEPLDARLTKRKLRLEETLAIVEDIASAVAAAHQKNIIHRDLKLGNVMLIADDTKLLGERAMVLDFGIAKLMQQGEGITSTGNLIGTPIYMAYEQIERPKEVDGRADTYSLGVMFYQMLCRRLPFPHSPGDTAFLVLSRKADPSIPIETYAPDLPAELRALVNAMVQKERTQRPTMTEVRAIVRRIQGLPAPQQTGGHDVVLAPPTPVKLSTESANDDTEEEDPTPSVQPSLIEVLPAPPTPSELKGKGEISPSPLPKPVSISDSPSQPYPVNEKTSPDKSDSLLPEPLLLPEAKSDVVPLFAPVKQSGPEERTPRAAPTHLLKDKNASPSSPTITAGQQPNQGPPQAAASPRPSPRSSRWVPLLVLLGVAGVVGTWALRHDWRERPAATSSDVSPSVVVPAPEPPPPLAEDLGVPPDLSSPPDLATHTRSHGHCVPRLADASCILSTMTARQKKAIEAALHENDGFRLCPGERLVITGLPRHPEVQAPASWAKHQTTDLFLFTLNDLPADVGAFPAKIEIVCPR